MCTHIRASIFVPAACFATGCLMIVALTLDLINPSPIENMHKLKA